MQMESISVELVDKWLVGFASSGAARKAWSVLRAILRRAIRWNLLDVDITRRDIQLPAKPHYEPVILGIRQQRSLLQGFYDHPLEAWLICAVSCGLRTEEGYGLEWSDIDLRAGVLHIEHGLQWVNGHKVVVPPKTELSRRTLPLPRFAAKRLRELKPREGGRLIGALTPPQVARQYKGWCKRYSLPHVTARNLRQSGRHAGHDRVRFDRLIRAMTRGITASQRNRLNQCPEAMRRASGRRSSIRRCIPRTRCSDCQAS